MTQQPVKTTLFVSQLLAGAGISLSPAEGTGVVTVAVGGSTPVTVDVTSATPPTTHGFDVQVVLSAASIAVAGNGNIVALRGETIVDSGSTVTAGYLYGVEGKATFAGTFNNGSDYLTGTLGQLNLSGATITAGHVAAVIANIQNPIANSNVDGIYIESSGPAQINSMLKGIANTNFIFDLSVDSGSPVAYAISSSTVTGGGTEGWLKINLGGVTRYIALANAVS